MNLVSLRSCLNVRDCNAVTYPKNIIEYKIWENEDRTKQLVV